MNVRLLFPLGRGLLALAFIGPGGTNLLEGWRAQQMSASAAVALLGDPADLPAELHRQAGTDFGRSRFTLPRRTPSARRHAARREPAAI